MAQRRFFWRLYALFIALTVVVFIAASEYAARGFRRFHYESAQKNLASEARLAAELIREKLLTPEADEDAFCKEIGRRADIRLTVVRPDGVVVADSNADPVTMDNHGRRPEVAEAFAGDLGVVLRYSDTTHEERMYVAVPVIQGGSIIAVVRTSIATEPLARTLRDFQHKLGLTALGLGAVVFVGVYFFLQRIRRPLADMRDGAERFASGDLNFRLRNPDYIELGALSDALNSMAQQMQGRIETIARQRDEMQVVFGSMDEAVIAVDAAEKILQFNAAAAKLLGIEEKSAKGQLLTAVVRNTELLRLLRTALEKREPAAAEIVLHLDDEQERIVQVRATPLHNAAGGVLGAMIVADDFTQVRRLERVRRDFVANVSHELKTPLTSIRGFVETLQDGALEDPASARRFLDIIARQVARLQEVLADLLALSRIEQQHERGELSFDHGEIRPVIEAAIELCSMHAKEKGITIRFECPADAGTRMNAALLEQAAVNLIENAVKYSEGERVLEILVAREEGGWKIDFTDQGRGIEARHLERIFERFYRVDAARGRGEGGTGLGLSIVKHIILAHGGSVSVASTPGTGSTFTLHLPA